MEKATAKKLKRFFKGFFIRLAIFAGIGVLLTLLMEWRCSFQASEFCGLELFLLGYPALFVCFLAAIIVLLVKVVRS